MNTSISSRVKRIAHCIAADQSYYILACCYRHCRQEWDPKYRASKRRMVALKDKHQGERCFIIGNGPSLRDTDLSFLKDEVTFGLNRIYLLFEETGFAATYYVCVNDLVVAQCAREIVEQVHCPKFISWRGHNLIDFTADMMFLDSRYDSTFRTDITEGVGEGATVTYVAMQIAYHMGFQKVVLIGVDHSFAAKGAASEPVVSQGDDPNHFDPEYFGKGFRWQLPDLETSELAYHIAKYRFERDKREIVDATIGGKLQVFPKVDYRTLFA